MRLHELAKELKITSKDILSKVKELDIDAKSHMSTLDAAAIDKIRVAFGSRSKKEKISKKEKPVEQAEKKAAKKEKIKEEIKKPAAGKELVETKKVEVKKADVVEIKETPVVKPIAEKPAIEVEVEFPISVKTLSAKINTQPSVIIKKLMEEFSMLATINQPLEEETAKKVAANFGYALKKILSPEEVILKSTDKPEELLPRYPVVTLMGHVDHGKTSLLDVIRKTRLADYEIGGITQHIGAYEVNVASHAQKGQSSKITFLDTPGHEAFTAMRARGAVATDIVILVVAADDGVMPQTIEALDHAKDANVPILVAVNKIDKPQVDINRVKSQLDKLGLKAEDWGGKTIMVGVSAKTGQGIDELLEMVLLEAEMMELKANPKRPAYGVVIEAKMSKGRGIVTTVLVKNGTLHQNDFIVAGNFYGKVRAMFDDHSKQIQEAGPSKPVEILGLSGVPEAGEQFFVAQDEQQARKIVAAREEQERAKKISPLKRVSLDELSAQIKEGKIKELKLIIKADVQGSLEALVDSLKKLPTNEVGLSIVHTGVGVINRSDIMLASVSDAIIVGFHVGADGASEELARQEGVEIRTYRLIYEAIEEIKAALEGLLEPKLKKLFLGKVVVRKVFKVTKGGTIAGSLVQKGKITRSCFVSLLRNGQVVYEGNLTSLKRFKDDVREVGENMECGISLGIDDINVGDVIEAYEIQKIARKL